MSRPLRPGVRLALGAIVIVLGVSAIGSFAFGRLFEPTAEVPAPAQPQPQPQPQRPPPPGPPTLRFEVVATRGGVERHRPSEAWRPLNVGDEFAADDELRTDETGQVDLSVGSGSLLTVAASTELRVRELSPALHQLQLKRGRLAAKYDADGQRVLHIEDENGKTVAVTRGATFSILASGQALAIATETGTVSLEAGGGSVEVGPGQQSHSFRGGAPSEVTPIRAEVLLKIARAGHPAQTLCAEIVGTVEAGAEVRLDGEPVAVDDTGQFSAKIPRQEGRASARIAVRDVRGRPRETVVPCVAAVARDPKLKLDLRWGAPATAPAP